VALAKLPPKADNPSHSKPECGVDLVYVLFVILSLIFAVHGLVFLRQYRRSKRQFYYLATSLGFALLVIFYGNEGYTQLAQSGTHHGWMYYVRISGIALCAVSLPILIKRLYLWAKGRIFARSQAQSAAKN
jgi:uncharacterized membrane protein YozB (DUF420 family)